MKIPVDRITDSPRALDFQATAAWWQERVAADAELASGLADPVRVHVSVHRMGDDLYLDGALEGALDLVCGRCLSRYRQPIRERFRLVLEPAGSRVPADPEGAELLASSGLHLSDELDTGWYRGSEIRLDRFVQEVIALLFPVQPLCREDCRGLCPRCGIDRNTDSCSCEEVRTSSPFAVLETLRDRLR